MAGLSAGAFAFFATAVSTTRTVRLNGGNGTRINRGAAFFDVSPLPGPSKPYPLVRCWNVGTRRAALGLHHQLVHLPCIIVGFGRRQRPDDIVLPLAPLDPAVSKVYAMSGWRIGYMALPEGLATHVLKVHDATMICAPRVSQVAAIAALSDPALPPPNFRQTLDARRQLICERLDRVPQLFSYVRPQGAYYVFPRIVGAERDSRAFSIRLLEDVDVVVTPGAAFGPSGEGHVRMAYCVDEETINGAFDRLESLVANCGL